VRLEGVKEFGDEGGGDFEFAFGFPGGTLGGLDP
jgi:hypothetical protein